MTAAGFRRLALQAPEAEENSHMGHPDFRVKGKVFATLGAPGPQWGMVKLTPRDQASYVAEKPGVFEVAKGAWGAHGATYVHLKGADRAVLKSVIMAAWCNVAPRKLVKAFFPTR